MNEILSKAVTNNDWTTNLLLSIIAGLGAILLLIIKSAFSWYKTEAEEKRKANKELGESLERIHDLVKQHEHNDELRFRDVESKISFIEKEIERLT